MCSLPDKAAENVKAAVLSAVQVHAEDGRKDQQHHSEIKDHDHCRLREKRSCYYAHIHTHTQNIHIQQHSASAQGLCPNHNDPYKFNFKPCHSKTEFGLILEWNPLKFLNVNHTAIEVIIQSTHSHMKWLWLWIKNWSGLYPNPGKRLC